MKTINFAACLSLILLMISCAGTNQSVVPQYKEISTVYELSADGNFSARLGVTFSSDFSLESSFTKEAVQREALYSTVTFENIYFTPRTQEAYDIIAPFLREPFSYTSDQYGNNIRIAQAADEVQLFLAPAVMMLFPSFSGDEIALDQTDTDEITVEFSYQNVNYRCILVIERTLDSVYEQEGHEIGVWDSVISCTVAKMSDDEQIGTITGTQEIDFDLNDGIVIQNNTSLQVQATPTIIWNHIPLGVEVSGSMNITCNAQQN